MKHLSEAELALYAGGDLNWWKQRWAERHVRSCGLCQTAAAEFSELRSEIPVFPKLAWNRLSSEMQANIRLGLEAGECVGRSPVRSFVSGQRLAVVGGTLGILMVAGIWMQRPSLHVPSARSITGPILEAAESGIQVREGKQTFRIFNSSNRGVRYSVGSAGELRARSLDPETGNVTITHVYGD